MQEAASHAPSSRSTNAHGRTSPLLEISNAIVALHKRYYGKGPTTAKTYVSGELVTVLLRGGFTRVERTLHEEGRGDAVQDQRRAFQDTMMQRFRDVVEGATGRKVVAFMSSSDIENEYSCEIFVLDGEISVERAESLGAGPDAPGLEGGAASPTGDD